MHYKGNKQLFWLMKYYNSINILSESDLKYIVSYLAFPQKYWKTSKDYYKDIEKNKANIDQRVYLSSLNKSVKNLNYHIKFINDIVTLMEKYHWQINSIY